MRLEAGDYNAPIERPFVASWFASSLNSARAFGKAGESKVSSGDPVDVGRLSLD